jgi:phosphatidylinositol alpha-mannosyltransferase
MLLRRIVSKLDVTTATSPVSRSAIDRFTAARIVPNGIDLAAYKPQDKIPLSVTFLGRDDQRKGLDVLLDAWPEVADKVPGAILTIMSAHRESERDDVVYLGRVSEDQKAEVLGTSEIYVAPNLGGESFGIVVAEGMASGCAVIASAIPAFAHVAGDSAEFVAPNDPRGLAQRIIEVLMHDARRANLQSAALERVVRFDGASVARQFVDAYEDAIARH